MLRGEMVEKLFQREREGREGERLRMSCFRERESWRERENWHGRNNMRKEVFICIRNKSRERERGGKM